MARMKELTGESKPVPPKPNRSHPAGINRLYNVDENQPAGSRAPRSVAPANSFGGAERPPAYQSNNQMSTGLGRGSDAMSDGGW